MNKVLIENIISGNLLECEKYIDELLKEKCLNALSEKKQDILETRNNVAGRLYKKLRKLPRKFGDNSNTVLAGRKVFSVMHPTSEDIIDEDKNPTRIKTTHAMKILKKGGYQPIRTGEHQLWRHSTDKNKKDFALPHHSKELSPALTRQLYTLVSEDIILDVINTD